VIRPARWLPLSLAVHAAMLGGGVWVAREIAERPLFVDLTLNEDERAGAAGSGGAAPAAAPATRGAPSSARPAPAPSRSRAPSSSASAPSAPATAPNAAPPSPAATSGPVASSTPVPESSPTVETSPTVQPAPAVPSSPVADSSSTGGTGVASTAPSASGGSAESVGGASVGTDGGDSRGATSQAAGAGTAGGRGAGDGQLALAMPGAGGGAEMYGPYLAALRRRLQEMLEYPPAARRRGLSGTVDLEIALESTGRVSEVVVVRSSSYDLLDDAALTAARKLSRVPFPPDVRPRALRVRMPVVFELR